MTESPWGTPLAAGQRRREKFARAARRLALAATDPSVVRLSSGQAGDVDNTGRVSSAAMATPLVIGHACAAGEAPANTLAGVRAALDAGAEAMELDVQLCADGIPILMHDETVDRTTNIKGAVRSLSLAELQAADAGNGEPVPTLDAVFGLVAGRLTIMCELKRTKDQPEQDQRLVDAVLAVAKKHNATDWCAIHSFNPEMVERARKSDPRISATIIAVPARDDGPVTGQDPAAGPQLDAARVARVLGVPAHTIDGLVASLLDRNGQALSLEHHYIDRALVLKAKRRQVTVWAWTADTPEDWARLIEAGVDGIITNVPHQLRDYLEMRH